MRKITFILAASILLIVSGCMKMTDHQNMNPTPATSDHQSMDMGNTGLNTASDIQAKWIFSKIPQSNHNEAISILIQDKDGNPVKDFEIAHEKLMHLIVVSKDLSFFEHIHPEYKGNGLFTITTQFPSGGDYKLYADIVPKGGKQTVPTQMVTVQGTPAKDIPLQPDGNLTQAVNGIEVTLAFNHVVAGMDLNMTYTFKDAKTKDPIKNLQPYLGAVGHVVIISEDTESYLHVHPTEEKSSGPEAKFMTNFAKSGVYKIWGQFQHEGKVLIVPFMVKVP
jgi:hypothetical protein